MQASRNSKCLKEKPTGKEIREFLEKHKLKTDRNTVHRLKKGVKEVNCGDFIFIEDFLDFVSKSKVMIKDGREVKGHSHLEKSQEGNHFRRAFVGVPQSKAVALTINPVFSLDATFLTSSSRGVAMSIVGKDQCGNLVPVAYSVAPYEDMCHWRYFLKQLIVFMPELNEKDHKTVFITDGKPGLKELIQDIFTNVEVSECTFHMKVNLMKRLGGHKDKKAILGLFGFLAVTNNTEKYKVGMEAIKDMSEDAYNFLTKTHSVSDWAASQFKYDHYGVTASSWCESLHSVYTRRHFKEASLCDFMCSVYNYTVNLLCSRRDNIITNKPADGTVLTQRDWKCTRKSKRGQNSSTG